MSESKDSNSLTTMNPEVSTSLIGINLGSFKKELDQKRKMFHIMRDSLKEELVYGIDYECLQATKKNESGQYVPSFGEPDLTKIGSQKIVSLWNIQPIYKHDITGDRENMVLHSECRIYLKSNKTFLGLGNARRLLLKDRNDVNKTTIMADKNSLKDALYTTFAVRSLLKEVCPKEAELFRMKSSENKYKFPAHYGEISDYEEDAEDPTDTWISPPAEPIDSIASEVDQVTSVIPVQPNLTSYLNEMYPKYKEEIDQIFVSGMMNEDMEEYIKGLEEDSQRQPSQENSSTADAEFDKMVKSSKKEPTEEEIRRNTPASPEDLEFYARSAAIAKKKGVLLFAEGIKSEDITVGMIEDFKDAYKKALFGKDKK